MSALRAKPLASQQPAPVLAPEPEPVPVPEPEAAHELPLQSYPIGAPVGTRADVPTEDELNRAKWADASRMSIRREEGKPPIVVIFGKLYRGRSWHVVADFTLEQARDLRDELDGFIKKMEGRS